jgi:hypothetical protein
MPGTAARTAQFTDTTDNSTTLRLSEANIVDIMSGAPHLNNENETNLPCRKAF